MSHCWISPSLRASQIRRQYIPVRHVIAYSNKLTPPTASPHSHCHPFVLTPAGHLKLSRHCIAGTPHTENRFTPFVQMTRIPDPVSQRNRSFVKIVKLEYITSSDWRAFVTTSERNYWHRMWRRGVRICTSRNRLAKRCLAIDKY